MSDPEIRPRRRRLGELLLDEGLITEQQLTEGLRQTTVAGRSRERLGRTIVRLGYASEADIARCLAVQLGLELFSEPTLVCDPSTAALLPTALAERHAVVPLRQDPDGTLVIACSDPTNVLATDDIRLATGIRRIRQVVATPTAIDEAVRRTYRFGQQSAVELLGSFVDQELTESELGESASDGPIVQLVDGILTGALESAASDVHVEPGRDQTIIRYRIDGVLQRRMTVPRSATPSLISRLKLMSGMDIAERRRPQDGRTVLRSRGQEVDLRISTIPSLYGETVVLRLLGRDSTKPEIDDIGLTPEQAALVRGAIERPQGLILLTGPTGSGKTSSLYAFLGEIVSQTRNVVTLEDPVEYQLEGVNQTQVKDDIGLTFARSLRTVLRQDPDIIMVGEIRDLETAELALQAALTGHLVLSTLHTNDAAGAVVRLRDLGIADYLVGSSVIMLVAQRLVRLVCDHCAISHRPTDFEIIELGLTVRDLEQANFRIGGGCPHCGDTGYRGRTGLFEVLLVDASTRQAITSGGTETAIRHAARVAGMRSLAEDGLRKAMAGITTLEELLRVAPMAEDQSGICRVCAQTIEPDFNVCPWCAADLRPEACTTCARPLRRGWALCPGCGTPTASPDGDASRLPRVLVIDDDPSVTAAVAAMLAGEFEVVEAHDGDEGLKSARGQRPDVVLCDVTMPGKNGYEVTRELRSRPVTMKLPIMLMTGNDDRDTELAGLRSGADDYIGKPLDPDVLAARIEAVLRRAPTEGPG